MAGNFKLRKEAGLLEPGAITPEQLEAGNQLHALIEEMVASTEKVDRPAQGFLPRIDKERSNRVLLIDGGRGSGKTALLITMLELWRRYAVDAAKRDDLKEPLKSWASMAGRVIPVGLLDLHPLPPSTNLLFHVVGRFERVVEWIEGDGKSETEPAAWHFQDATERASRKAWQRLLRAVAAGWDGNVRERSARLDLETYTAELEESERQRLNLVDTFAAFVDALVEDFCKRRHLDAKSPPLFVLAIDDADMEPSRSVELLETVRMLWHPRVTFVLTGDSTLFEHTLAEHYLGALRKPLLDHGIIAGELEGLTQKRRHMQLATEVYEKIVPPGHRCRLPPIAPAQAMKVDVGTAEQDGAAQAATPAGGAASKTTLEHIFAAIWAEPETAGEEGTTGRQTPTLDTYFTQTRQLCEALPDRLRGIIDLAQTAQVEIEAPKREIYAPASRVVEAIWRHAVRSVGMLPDGYDEDTVRVDESTGALEIQISRNPPGMWATDIRWIARKREPGLELNLGAVTRFDAPVDAGRLPRRLTAALMLAADVAADQTKGGWNVAEARQGGYEGVFAKAFLTPSGTSSQLRFAWPLPPGFPLPFYAAFASRWAPRLRDERRRKEEPWEPTAAQLDELARHFVYLVVYLWRGSETLWSDDTPPDWETLAKLVTNLGTQGAAPWRAWARQRAGLLAAPEYGLPAESANAWLEALLGVTGENERMSLLEGLRAERRLRVTNAGENQAERTIVAIDEAFLDHVWAQVVEQREAPAQRARSNASEQPEARPLHELKAKLQTVGVDLPMTVWTSEKLAALPAEQISELAAGLRPFEGHREAHTEALLQLWKMAARMDRAEYLSDAVGIINDRLALKQPTIMDPIESPIAWTGEIQCGSITLVPNFYFLRQPFVEVSGVRLPPLLDALYPFLWDFAIVRRDDALMSSPLPSGWYAAEIQCSEPKGWARWPTFRWPMFRQIQRVTELWNLALSNAAMLPSFQARVDALAYWLLDISKYGYQAEMIQKYSLSTNCEWEVAASLAMDTLLRAPSPFVRQSARQWRETMPLFAAPESALSGAAAAGILMAFHSGPRWLRLAHAHRREGVLVPGMPPESRSAFLRAIDREAEAVGHPWVLPPAPPKRSSATRTATKRAAEK